jgi:hypothetical protein
MSEGPLIPFRKGAAPVTAAGFEALSAGSMSPVETFDRALTGPERRVVGDLTAPDRVQAFLDSIAYSTDRFYRCPRRVLRERVGHCFDGALFAAAMLRRFGHQPLILDMVPNDRDDDHVLALFKEDGHWGAVATSNFAGLRFREPVYRNLRELVMSYFEQYYNVTGEKTLRGYTRPVNLEMFDPLEWMTKDEPLERIAQRLDTVSRTPLLTEGMIERLTPVDGRSLRAGLLGADETGLYRPEKGDRHGEPT